MKYQSSKAVVRLRVEVAAFFASSLPRFCASMLLLLLLAFAFVCDVSASSGGEILWQAGGTHAGIAKAMISDASGNVIIAGYTTEAGSEDFVTLKLNADGTEAWRKIFDKSGNDTGNDRAAAVAVDSNGDIIVTGYVRSGTTDDIYTIKYCGATRPGPVPAACNAGDIIWEKSFNGSANGNDYSTAVAVGSDGVDGQDTVYVAGYSQASNGMDDFVIIKYKSDGTLGTFGTNGVITYNGSANKSDRINSLDVNSTGVAVTGYSANSNGYFECLTIKYDTSGTKLWEYRYTVPGVSADGRGLVVRMDTAGNVFMTGYVPNGSNRDIYLAKIDKDADPAFPGQKKGKKLWDYAYDGGYNDEPADLWVSANGADIYLTGYKYSNESDKDFYTARHDGSTGARAWYSVFNFSGGSIDIPTSLAVDSVNGYVYVTGTTALNNNNDFLTLKYKDKATEAVLLWSKTFNGAADKNDTPMGIRLASSGNIYVAGWSEKASGSDFYAIKYDGGTINRPTGLSAAAFSNTRIDLSWVNNASNAESFKIERCSGTTCSDFAEIASENVPNVIHSDTGLTQGTKYHYRVRAYSAAEGYSYYSDEADAIASVIVPGIPGWIFTYDGGVNGGDVATAIAAGPDNNPIVTGYSSGMSGNYDYYTVKLDRTDHSIIWESRFDGSQPDQATCLAVDNSGNVIVSGKSFTYSETSLKDTDDIYTLKYSATGPADNPPLWEVGFDGPAPAGSTDSAVAVKTDPSGNVIVVGYGTNTGRADNDIYIIKYPSTCSSGCSPYPKLWATLYDGGGEDKPTSMAVDSSGNIVVAGYTYNSSNFDFFTAKYCGASTGAKCNDTSGNPVKNPGDLIWSVTYNGPGNGDDGANDVAVDPSGNVYVAGYRTNASGNKDFYTVKYRGTDGAVRWERFFDGPGNGDDTAMSVRIDPIDGGVVVAGTTLTGPGDNDFHIIKYNGNNGDTVWEKNLDRHSNDDYAAAMGMDPSGYICVAGKTSNSNATTDILAVKYDYNGVLVAEDIYSGTGNGSLASSVVSNNLGELFVAGRTINASGNSDFIVFKCSGAATTPVPAPFAATPVAGSTNSHQINLSWSKAMYSGSVKFKLEREDSPGVWTAIIDYPANYSSATYQDSGLAGNREYCYRIEADDGVALSRKLPVCVTTIPDPPSIASLTPGSDTAVTVSWNNVSGNIAYKVEHSTGGAYTTACGGELSQDTVSCADSGLSGGITYTYKLYVKNLSGWSLAGATSSTITYPSMPTGLTVSSPTDRSLYVNWNQTTGNTGYVLDRSTDQTNWTQIPLAQNQNTYTDNNSGNGLASGIVFYYRVMASGSSGNSGYTSSANGKTKLVAPTITSVTPDATTPTTKLTVSWADTNPDARPGSANETGFSVYYSACTNNNPAACGDVNGAYWGGWSSAVTAAANATSVTLTGLTTGRTYRVRMQATLSGADSDYSGMLSATTKFASGPLQSAPVVVNSSQITLAWGSAVLGTANYDVWQSGAGCSGGADKGLGLSNSTFTTTVSGLSADTQYCFKIKAYNSGDYIYSDGNTCKCATTPLDPTTMISATADSQTQITVSWNAGSGATAYRLKRRTGDCNFALATTTIPSSGNLGNVTTYQDGPLSNGTLYCYKAEYTVNGTNWSPSSSNSVSAATFPAAPTVSASPASVSAITVTWGAVTGATSYKISVDGGGYNNATSPYNSSGLTQGTTHTYKVQACNASGCSGDSNTATATALLPAPTGLTVYNVTASSISISWNAVAGVGSNGYQVQRVSPALSTNTTALNYTDSGRTAGTQYCYRVSSFNSANNVGPTTTPDVCATTIPSAPTVSASPASVSAITVTWGAVSGATSYKISVDGGGYNNATSPYSSSGLTQGTTHTYKVQACNASGCSGDSNTATATALLPAPTGLTVYNVTASSISISWDAVAGVGSNGYQVQRVSPALSTNTTALNYTDSGRTAGTQYCYRVSSFNSANNVGPTTTPDVCATIIPAAPTVSATPSSVSAISVTWGAVTGASSYKVSVDGGAYNNASSPYNSSGLTQGTTHTYKVQACNASGCSGDSNTATATALLPAPTGLTAYNVTASSISISWDAVTGVGSNGYQVQRVSPALSTNTTALNYADGGRTAGIQYCYRVSSFNSVNNAGPTTTPDVCATTIPGAPTVSASPKSGTTNEITVTWGAVTGATGYKISVDGGGYNNAASPYSSSPLTQGTTHTYKVQACNASGCSVDSNTATATVLLPAPTGLLTPDVTSSSITLSWDQMTANNGYKIERKSPSAGTYSTLVTQTSASQTGYTDSIPALASATQYCYRVSTYNSANNLGAATGDNSACVPTLPTAPTGLTATVINTTRVDLSWTDTTGSESGFTIERCTGPSCDFSIKDTFSAGSNAVYYSDTSACKSTTYRYRVKAVNTLSGDSTYSNTVSAVTPESGSITSFTATKISEVQIGLAWTTTTTDQTGFEVDRCLDSGFTQSCVTLIAASGALSCQDTGQTNGQSCTTQGTNLTPDTTYYYRVRAYKTCDAGCGGRWNTAYSTTASKETTSTPTTLWTNVDNTTQITLNWTDNTVTESGFEIWTCKKVSGSIDCTQDNQYSLLATTGQNVVTYADSSVYSSSIYNYKVRAVHAAAPAWNSPFSNIAQATTGTPLSPTNLSVSESAGSMTVTWTDNTTDETGFRVYRCDMVWNGDPQVPPACTLGPALINSGNCAFLSDGTSGPGTGSRTCTESPSGAAGYCYYVSAYKTATHGWETTPTSTKCGPLVLSKPVNLAATALNSRKIKLQWSDASFDETGTEIEARAWNGSWVKIATVGQHIYEYTDTVGINPNTTYAYRVRVVRNAPAACYTFNNTLNDSCGSPSLNLTGTATYEDSGLRMTGSTSFQSASTDILNNDNHKIEFDIKVRNTNAAWTSIFNYRPGWSDRSPGIWMKNSDSRIHWRYDPLNNTDVPLNTGVNALGVDGDGGTPLVAGQWYHITGVKRADNFKVYVNNALVVDMTVANPKTAGSSPLYFGGADVTLRNFYIYKFDTTDYSNTAYVTTPAYTPYDSPCDYNLTVNVVNPGSGVVNSSLVGVGCGANSSTPYVYAYVKGASVTLSAVPNAGKTFTGWSGACSGSLTTCVVTMDGTKSVTATFSP